METGPYERKAQALTLPTMGRVSKRNKQRKDASPPPHYSPAHLMQNKDKEIKKKRPITRN
ncbi:hypothetical protein E2C01_041289 [Portunus trituberculatus]|uniref:Uncharacterized protein n=1 Tax=Portunus trituberculatus TaxID=210409 RepID=A0A5B7FIU9_PORTR|nr:hypothetical protein [Portunus trituberculatus]